MGLIRDKPNPAFRSSNDRNIARKFYYSHSSVEVTGFNNNVTNRLFVALLAFIICFMSIQICYGFLFADMYLPYII